MVMIMWFLLSYVDDLVITSSDADTIHKVKSDLWLDFYMIDLLHSSLGIEFWQLDHIIFVSQVKYAKNLIDKFRWQIVFPCLHLWRLGLKFLFTLIYYWSVI